MLDIPRSAIYYKNKEKLPDIKLESEVERIFKKSRRNYGTRKIQVEPQALYLFVISMGLSVPLSTSAPE